MPEPKRKKGDSNGDFSTTNHDVTAAAAVPQADRRAEHQPLGVPVQQSTPPTRTPSDAPGDGSEALSTHPAGGTSGSRELVVSHTADDRKISARDNLSRTQDQSKAQRILLEAIQHYPILEKHRPFPRLLAERHPEVASLDMFVQKIQEIPSIDFRVDPLKVQAQLSKLHYKDLIINVEGGYVLNVSRLIPFIEDPRAAIKNTELGMKGECGNGKEENRWQNHFNMGAVEREVYGYFLYMRRKHKNWFVFSSLETIREHCFKWVHPNRWSKKWVKSGENYSMRQVQRGISVLEAAGMITFGILNGRRGWFVHDHDEWTWKYNKYTCCLKNHPIINPAVPRNNPHDRRDVSDDILPDDILQGGYSQAKNDTAKCHQADLQNVISPPCKMSSSDLQNVISEERKNGDKPLTGQELQEGRPSLAVKITLLEPLKVEACAHAPLLPARGASPQDCDRNPVNAPLLSGGSVETVELQCTEECRTKNLDPSSTLNTPPVESERGDEQPADPDAAEPPNPIPQVASPQEAANVSNEQPNAFVAAFPSLADDLRKAAAWTEGCYGTAETDKDASIVKECLQRVGLSDFEAALTCVTEIYERVQKCWNISPYLEKIEEWKENQPEPVFVPVIQLAPREKPLAKVLTVAQGFFGVEPAEMTKITMQESDELVVAVSGYAYDPDQEKAYRINKKTGEEVPTGGITFNDSDQEYHERLQQACMIALRNRAGESINSVKVFHRLMNDVMAHLHKFGIDVPKGWIPAMNELKELADPEVREASEIRSFIEEFYERVEHERVEWIEEQDED